MSWRDALAGPVIFTNGVFDILHAGHVSLLERARALGTQLIVAINSDASARTLGKAPGRPLVAALDRIRVVAALEAVDCVVAFDQPTPYDVINALHPDVLVKGGDYREEQVVGRDLVLARGGRMVILPLLADRSTTSLVERIRGET